MKEVNVKVQCLATLFVPTGIYAFKRIKNLKLGVAIYGFTYSLWILQMLFMKPNFNDQTSLGVYGLLSFMNTMLGIVLPMVCMYVWSKDYNKKIRKESISI